MSFNRLMKLFLSAALLAVVVSLTACSFSTTFVVVNESSDRIQIRYVLKKPNYPVEPGPMTEPPAIMLVSELGTDVLWRDLSPALFTYNAETRTAVVTLMPNQALRVERMKDTECGDPNPRREEGFKIEEINVIGSSGAIRLTGEQVRQSFLSGRKGMCQLVYR